MIFQLLKVILHFNTIYSTLLLFFIFKKKSLILNSPRQAKYLDLNKLL